MRKMSETIKMLEIIDANMHREFDEEGAFKSASFEMSDGSYKIANDFTVRKLDDAGDVKELQVNYCKGGVYPEVYISGMPVKLYVLIMLATDDTAFEKYKEGLEINHTVISRIEPKKLNIGDYHAEVVISTAPLKELSYNPNYLEFVTRSENIKHGKFIHTYELYNVYVSAKDVDTLKELLIPYDQSLCDRRDDWIRWNKERVESFYRVVKGETKQIIF